MHHQPFNSTHQPSFIPLHLFFKCRAMNKHNETIFQLITGICRGIINAKHVNDAEFLTWTTFRNCNNNVPSSSWKNVKSSGFMTTKVRLKSILSFEAQTQASNHHSLESKQRRLDEMPQIWIPFVSQTYDLVLVTNSTSLLFPFRPSNDHVHFSLTGKAALKSGIKASLFFVWILYSLMNVCCFTAESMSLERINKNITLDVLQLISAQFPPSDPL